MICLYETPLKSAEINMHTTWICCMHVLRFFTEVWFLELQTLKAEEVRCFTMSGTDYPMTQHCIPEKQNPEG